MTIFPFQAMLPVLEQIDDPENFFSQVREHYATLLTEGFFRRIKSPGFFLYEIEHAAGKHRGLICTLSLDDYRTKKALRHEHTINTKVKIQVELLQRRSAVVKPVLLTYRETSSIHDWMSRYVDTRPSDWCIPFSSRGEQHRCWMVSDRADIEELQTLFAQEVNRAYIADGHHRMETSDRYFKGQHGADAAVLCGLFADTMLRIEGFHRIIKTELAAQPAKLLDSLRPIFEIKILTQQEKPRRVHELCMYLAGTWYRLHWKESYLKPSDTGSKIFDTALLHRHVLTDIFDIWDVRASANVSYEAGDGSLTKVQEAVDEDPNSVAFCLYPVSIKAMMEVADADKVLPPKSTWFEPRLRNGIIVQELPSVV